MLLAHKVADAIQITAQYTLECQLVLETDCSDFDAYKALPKVVHYNGIECVLTGWSSDSHRACYKEVIQGRYPSIAHKVR